MSVSMLIPRTNVDKRLDLGSILNTTFCVAEALGVELVWRVKTNVNLATLIFLYPLYCDCTRRPCMIVFLTRARYYCHQPTIDSRTQSEVGCRPNGTVAVPCFAAPNVTCGGKIFSGTECTFTEEWPCRYV